MFFSSKCGEFKKASKRNLATLLKNKIKNKKWKFKLSQTPSSSRVG
jgi:hypothetical protein